MSAAHAPLRIEIVDPLVEPLDTRRIEVVASSTGGPAVDEWWWSAAELGDAVRGRLAPLGELAAATVGPLRRLARAVNQRSLQLRSDGNPRRASAVRRRVFEPFPALLARLEGVADELPVPGGGRLRFDRAFSPVPGGGRQAPATLSIRWSWPRLPVVVRVEPWWREQTVVTVELRTRRRLRYPRRYFHRAHAATQAVRSAVSGPGRA